MRLESGRVGVANWVCSMSLGALLACGAEPSAVSSPSATRELPVQTRVILTEPYLVDQIYRSMKGPSKVKGIQIDDQQPPERIWVVSYATEIVDPVSGATISEEFMCHNNLDFQNGSEHQNLLGSKRGGTTAKRLFTLSQGAMDVQFPRGFGMPIMSNEKFYLTTQILNLNPIESVKRIRYRTTVNYVRDQDARGRLRPLYQKGVQGLKLLAGSDGFPGVVPGNTEGHGESCSIGELAGEVTIPDKYGRKFAAHWIVEPGLEENHTLVTEMLNLTRDTTVHYIATHLHPFAESLELRDLTTGESVFESRATNSKGRIGLDHVDSFSSIEGVPLYKDHEYALVSVYDNKTDEQQDAMAVMFIYMLDGNFEEKLLEN